VTVGEGGAGVIRRARSYIAEEPGKTYGAILLLKKDDATGDLSFAIPGFARDSATGILDMLEGRMTPEASMALLDIPIGGLLHAGLSGARQTPETLAALRAYHGSPHIYKAERRIRLPDGTEQFIEGGVGKLPDVPEGATVLKDYPAGRMRSDKIGTGEGNQAFSYGLYNAENEGVAAGYKARLAPNSTKPKPLQDAKKKTAEMWRKRANEARSDYEAIEDKWSPEASRASQEMRFAEGQAAYFEPEAATGALYTTKIDVEADDLLDWDAPLSEQSAKVRAAWAAAMESVKAELPVESFNVRLADDFANLAAGGTRSLGIAVRVLEASGVSGDKVSAALREAGIPGIRYLDQGSRGAGEGTRNFVIFDDKLIDIEAVDGKAVAGALPVDQVSPMAPLKTPQFKNWFGDSKALDDVGNPLVLYHATRDSFDQYAEVSGADFGFHFGTADAANARLEGTRGLLHIPGKGPSSLEGEHIQPVVLSIKKPLRVEDPGYFSVADPADNAFAMQLRDLGVNVKDGASNEELRAAIEKAGYDGLVYDNLQEGGQSWVALRPEQIKSVHNSGGFKSDDPSILASVAGGGVAASAVTTAASDRKDRKKKP
jgi:hypothetical protein